MLFIESFDQLLRKKDKFEVNKECICELTVLNKSDYLQLIMCSCVKNTFFWIYSVFCIPVPYICPKIWEQTNHIIRAHLANFYSAYKCISEGLVHKSIFITD
jgi:hypothetical protein